MSPVSSSSFLFFFFHCAACSFPDQGSNLCPLQWKHGVLTTGPPGNSLSSSFHKLPLSAIFLCIFQIIICLNNHVSFALNTQLHI